MSVIKKAINGDKEALIELIEEYQLKLYKIAKAILKNEEDVCDAIQETLISLYKGIGALQNEKFFKTWITRIVINKCYDIIKKDKIQNEKIVLMQNDYVEEQYIENSVIEKNEIQKALNSINEELRIITVLYYYNDLTVTEIAKVTSIPTGTVKSRLSRARNEMYNILKNEEVNKNEQ